MNDRAAGERDDNTDSGRTDMDVTGASYESNRQEDPFFTKELVSWLAGHVLGEGGDRSDPCASPRYADMKGAKHSIREEAPEQICEGLIAYYGQRSLSKNGASARQSLAAERLA
jgi:hypothetical protein